MHSFLYVYVFWILSVFKTWIAWKHFVFSESQIGCCVLPFGITTFTSVLDKLYFQVQLRCNDTIGNIPML